MKMKRILPMIAAAATTAVWAQQQPPATPGATPTQPSPPPAALPPGVIAVPPAGAPAAQPAALPPGAVASQPQAEAPPVGTKWVGQIAGDKVNARGRATVFSHRVFPFERGEQVFVLEEINQAKTRAGDVKKWVRVQVPGNVVLWVHSSYIDQKTLSVTASSLRVRSGSGEKYPIVGELPRGARVLLPQPAVKNKGPWMAIIAPANTSVYVAAQFVAKASNLAVTSPRPTPQPSPGIVNKVIPGGQPGTNNKIVGTTPKPGVTPPASVTPPVNKTPSGDIIITVPKSAFDPNQKNGGTTESFPAPPLPVKKSIPATPKNSGLNPRQPGTTIPGTKDKVVTSPPKPKETKKPAEQPKVETVEPPAPIKPAKPTAQPGTPEKVAPPAPVKPATPAKPQDGKKPGETGTKPDPAKPATPAKPVEDDGIKNKVKPVAKPKEEAKPKEKPPLRIVTREGVVHRTLNHQAPSHYVLEHIESGKVINFLMLDNKKLPLKLLLGRTILVSGEEAIDPRWLHTPVLKIKTLKTIDDTTGQP